MTLRFFQRAFEVSFCANCVVPCCKEAEAAELRSWEVSYFSLTGLDSAMIIYITLYSCRSVMLHGSGARLVQSLGPGTTKERSPNCWHLDCGTSNRCWPIERRVLLVWRKLKNSHSYGGVETINCTKDKQELKMNSELYWDPVEGGQDRCYMIASPNISQCEQQHSGQDASDAARFDWFQNKGCYSNRAGN